MFKNVNTRLRKGKQTMTSTLYLFIVYLCNVILILTQTAHRRRPCARPAFPLAVIPVTRRNAEVDHFPAENKNIRGWRLSYSIWTAVSPEILELFHKLYRLARQSSPVVGTMLNAAAAERNKEPILAVLRESVNTGRSLQALEISSGTGQHVTHFAQALRNIVWQPSEFDRQSIAR